jgi:hypothetical protein
MLAVRMQYLSEASASVAEVPADRPSGFAEGLGDLVAMHASRDARHDFALRRRQDAEYVGDPCVVFKCGKPAILSTFLALDIAAVDQALSHPAGSACLGLNEVVDYGSACIGERMIAYWPGWKHLLKSLGDRILTLFLRGPRGHRGSNQFGKRGTEELLEPDGGGGPGIGRGGSDSLRRGLLWLYQRGALRSEFGPEMLHRSRR